MEFIFGIIWQKLLTFENVIQVVWKKIGLLHFPLGSVCKLAGLFGLFWSFLPVCSTTKTRVHVPIDGERLIQWLTSQQEKLFSYRYKQLRTGQESQKQLRATCQNNTGSASVQKGAGWSYGFRNGEGRSSPVAVLWVSRWISRSYKAVALKNDILWATVGGGSFKVLISLKLMLSLL